MEIREAEHKSDGHRCGVEKESAENAEYVNLNSGYATRNPFGVFLESFGAAAVVTSV